MNIIPQLGKGDFSKQPRLSFRKQLLELGASNLAGAARRKGRIFAVARPDWGVGDVALRDCELVMLPADFPRSMERLKFTASGREGYQQHRNDEKNAHET
ncbi:MAG: hypothetical protein QOH88_2490 [Verrucomicrobiota bacterium]